MSADARFDRAIGALYDAAAEPARWPEALAAVSELLGAVGAQFFFWDPRADTAPFSVVSGFDPEDDKLYARHYGAIDPRRQFLDRLPVGTTFVCHERFPDDYVARSEFYQDFLIPRGGRYVIASQLLRQPDQVAVLGVHRGARMGPFEGEAVARFERLVPHLRRTARLQQRLWRIETERQAMAGALDRLPYGVVLVDARLRAAAVNRAAEDLLRVGDGLALRQGRLIASRLAEDSALQRLVGGAAQTACGLGSEAGGTLVLSRPSGKRPLTALVAPLRRDGRHPFPDLGPFEPLVVLFLLDPERESRPPAELLRRLYGLTAREAQVAGALVAGDSLDSAAETLGISRETARTYLKRIFAKTDTTRQAELVSLLLRTAGPLR